MLLKYFINVLLIFCVLFATNVNGAVTKIFHHPATKKATTAIVDLNKANEKVLETLKGVGAKRAKAIIAYRQKHGPYKSVAELKNVKSFSEKRIKRLLKANPHRIMISK